MNLIAVFLVLYHMMSVSDRRTENVEVWAAYKRAFRDFSAKARTVQQQAAKPAATRNDIEAAVLALEKARVAYSNARDALAQQLLNSPPRTPPTPPEPSPVHTAEVARLLWESVGRPEGTADSDWHRAEEIIRAALEENVGAGR